MSEMNDLLEQLVDRLDDLIREVRGIKEELNWTNNISFAKQVTDGFSSVERSLSRIESAIDSLER